MSAARQVWRGLCMASLKGATAIDDLKSFAARAEYAPFPAELGFAAGEYARALRSCARAWARLDNIDARHVYTPALHALANLVWVLLEPAASGRRRSDLDG
ncbi:MAG: hypothetical protein WA840_22950 [Caulobacteraceae bacterium]